MKCLKFAIAELKKDKHKSIRQIAREYCESEGMPFTNKMYSFIHNLVHDVRGTKYDRDSLKPLLDELKNLMKDHYHTRAKASTSS